MIIKCKNCFQDFERKTKRNQSFCCDNCRALFYHRHKEDLRKLQAHIKPEPNPTIRELSDSISEEELKIESFYYPKRCLK